MASNINYPSLCVLGVLLLTSWACMALGQVGPPETCVKKLLPCQGSLTSPSPPETCCAPLTEALKSETQCLCDVFNNEALLKSFNVTQEQALQLLKNCKATFDLHACNSTGGAGNGTSSAPPTSTPSTSTPSAATGSAPPSKSSAVSKKSLWGGVAVLSATWVSMLTLAS